MSTPKGRATPKAPQNQPKPKGPARTPSFEEREIERLLKMTPGQRAREDARERYLGWRRQTRPFRRAFSGDWRNTLRAATIARRALTRDSVEVARAVEALGGVEDIRSIAQRVEMPQARVRACLALLQAATTS